VFILYAIPVGILAGYAVGGRLERLADVQYRLVPLAIAALAVQLALFSPLSDGLAVDVGRAIYVVSTVGVLAVVVANVRLTGIPIVLVGAVSNVAAILANGLAMPANAGALASIGSVVRPGTNSVAVDHPNLEPLTDIFATPPWLPLANVFSVGDVLIGLGVAVAIAAAMRGPRSGRPEA
jgi:hypothetical protein